MIKEQILSKLENDGDGARDVVLASRVYGPGGNLAANGESRFTIQPGQNHVVSQNVEVLQPQLWSPASPALYRLETHCMEGCRSDRHLCRFLPVLGLLKHQ